MIYFFSLGYLFILAEHPNDLNSLRMLESTICSHFLGKHVSAGVKLIFDEVEGVFKVVRGLILNYLSAYRRLNKLKNQVVIYCYNVVLHV